MKRGVLITAIAVTLGLIFAVPLALLVYGAVGPAIGSLTFVACFIVLQTPVVVLARRWTTSGTSNKPPRDWF